MYTTIRLVLTPNNKQLQLFKQFTGTARFCYNEALSYWNSYYNTYKTKPKLQDLSKHLQDLKYNNEQGTIEI